MSKAVNELIETLNAEAALFENFLDLLDRQRDMVVANDTDGLVMITERQREKLAESKMLDRRRRELVEQVGSENAISGDVNVTRLLDSVSQDDGLRLSGVRDTIIELSKQIEKGKERNKFLINKSRELISSSLQGINRMSNPPEKGSAYTRPGSSSAKITQTNRISLALDKRI